MNGRAVRVEEEAGVARVTLGRPPLNLLEPGLIAALREAFNRLTADPSIRVALLSGEGRAFSAGMDVTLFRDMGPDEARRLIASLRDAIDGVWLAPFPTIASVHGACLGGAFELALACDMRIASEDAIFGLPEVRVGLPSVIHAALLPAIAGPTLAAEMLLTGSTLTAPEALAHGLVNRVVPVDRREAAETEFVGAVLDSAPDAVKLQKRLMLQWRRANLREAIDGSIDTFARAFENGEPREGAEAFLQKRPPAWSV